MSSSRTGLLPNQDWPGIIDRLLGAGTQAEQVAARETMWIEVQRYVVRFARLPIGPLTEDLEVRLDIAVSLLRRLEQGGCRHVRIWRERHRQRQAASWWGWIGLMTRTLAIDVARCSRQNLARRGEPFQWARVVSVDPVVFHETLRDALGRSLEFVAQAAPEDLIGYLGALRDLCAEIDGDSSGLERAAEPVALSAKLE